jgi:hypothetical protein
VCPVPIRALVPSAITDRLKAGISIGRVAKDAGTSAAMIEMRAEPTVDLSMNTCMPTPGLGGVAGR